MDLGANIGHVPLRDAAHIGTALVAGGLLAFALSFDEIIVTTFTAGRGHADPSDLDLQQLPATGPAAAGERRGAVRAALSIIPVYLAQRISSGGGGVAGSR